MNLRQWADAIADCMIEWEHKPIPIGEEGRWKGYDKIRHTYLEHVCGAQVSFQTEPERLISPGHPELEKDVPEDARLIFSAHWPRDDRYGYSGPNRHSDQTNYRATCSADRTPQSVVNGIQERFIKPYLHKWYALEAEMRGTLEKYDASLALVNELGALIGAAPHPDDWFTSNKTSASVAFLEISNWGDIHLTRRYSDKITPEFARKLLLLWSGQADIVMLDPVPVPDMPLFADIEELVP